MKEKFDALIKYIEDHLYALIFLAACMRVLAYLIESIRRCFIRRK